MPVSRVAAHSFCSSSLSADLDQRRQVGARRAHLGVPGLEARTALHEGQRAQVLALDDQRIVEADMGRELLELLLAHGLAVEPLLQVVEGRDVERRPLALAQHQQLAVEHRIEVEAGHHIGKGLADGIARARVELRLAAPRHDLHADAVPFPLGGELGEVERRPVARPPAGATASAGGTPARRRRRASAARPSSQANSGS